MLFEHGVLVRDVDELIIAEALGVGDVGKVGIASLAELADHQWLVKLTRMLGWKNYSSKHEIYVVLFEELLGVAVRVDVDLS